jgi:hypothetical protein
LSSWSEQTAKMHFRFSLSVLATHVESCYCLRLQNSTASSCVVPYACFESAWFARSSSSADSKMDYFVKLLPMVFLLYQVWLGYIQKDYLYHIDLFVLAC